MRGRNYVAHMWKKANTSKPIALDAEQQGWIPENGRYIINWIDCSQLPPSIMNIIGAVQAHTDDTDEEQPLAPTDSDEYDSDGDESD